MDLARNDGPKFESSYRRSDMLQAKPVYGVNEFHEISASGVVGSPELADKEKGQRFFEAITADIVAFVRDFATWR